MPWNSGPLFPLLPLCSTEGAPLRVSASHKHQGWPCKNAAALQSLPRDAAILRHGGQVEGLLVGRKVVAGGGAPSLGDCVGGAASALGSARCLCLLLRAHCPVGLPWHWCRVAVTVLMAEDHLARTSLNATHSNSPSILQANGRSSSWNGNRRVLSRFSVWMAILGGVPGILAGGGGIPGDDGGVCGADTMTAGNVGRGFATMPTSRLRCCLVGTILGGGVCTGEYGGVREGEVSRASPPLRECNTWSSCWTIEDVRCAPGMNGGTFRSDPKMEGGGIEVSSEDTVSGNVNWSRVVAGTSVVAAGGDCGWQATPTPGLPCCLSVTVAGGGVDEGVTRSIGGGEKCEASGSHISTL